MKFGNLRKSSEPVSSPFEIVKVSSNPDVTFGVTRKKRRNGLEENGPTAICEVMAVCKTGPELAVAASVDG